MEVESKSNLTPPQGSGSTSSSGATRSGGVQLEGLSYDQQRAALRPAGPMPGSVVVQRQSREQYDSWVQDLHLKWHALDPTIQLEVARSQHPELARWMDRSVPPAEPQLLARVIDIAIGIQIERDYAPPVVPPAEVGPVEKGDVETGDELTRLWLTFEQQTGSKTFYSGALSWLNNAVASAEDLGDWVTGDTSDPTWWGCADAAPALLAFFGEQYKGDRYRFELLTSRNVLGLQHNQVVAVPSGGGTPRVFDPWAGGEVPYGFDFDATLAPIGQVIELAVGGSVEGTGHGASKDVRGNQLLRIDTAIQYYSRLVRD